MDTNPTSGCEAEILGLVGFLLWDEKRCELTSSDDMRMKIRSLTSGLDYSTM